MNSERVIEISLFENEKDNVPKPESLTWRGLVGVLTDEFLRQNEKLGGPCWGPQKYRPGSTRALKNLESIGAAFFDLDDVTPARLDALFDRLDEAKVRFVAHSTWSSTAERPRCHLVLELPRSVTPAEWPRLYAALVRKFGVPADDKSKDAAHILFAPSCPPGSVPFVRVGLTP